MVLNWPTYSRCPHLACRLQAELSRWNDRPCCQGTSEYGQASPSATTDSSPCGQRRSTRPAVRSATRREPPGERIWAQSGSHGTYGAASSLSFQKAPAWAKGDVAGPLHCAPTAHRALLNQLLKATWLQTSSSKPDTSL